MSDLSHARFAKNPLVILALSLAIGILIFHYFDNANLAVAFVVAALVLLSVAGTIVRTVSAIATAFLLVAFMATGYVLALNEERSVSPNRVVRMFARGVLLPNEPVEVTGTIQGEPEVAPDGFYLTLCAERIRSKDGEHDASGEVLMLAHEIGRASCRERV